MIITIGGLAGSGTTTAAKILSEKMDVPYISAGDIFRQMAAEKGMDILEFSAFAENNINVDLEIDKRQAAIAKEKDNLIVEGRLSAFFVDAQLKIWFTAPLDVRAERISQRENKNFDVVKKEIIIREESEAKRYEDIHNINIKNMDLYDFIINTNRFKAENVADIILKVTEVIICQQ
ncbi:MAG: AAA family ATPase [Methanobacteriaceae archaeon]|nr:AAA family ATPase [Methanobacteriaceae archaeon]